MSKHSMDPLGITRLCASFLKGITYFSMDPSFPMHHRIFSCDAHTDCQATLPGDEKKRRARIAETCYIERSVYNLLYEHEVLHLDHAQQNEGHKKALDIAEKDYDKCFPGTRLSLRLVYEGRIPTQLIIERQRGRSKTVETYVHNGHWRTDINGTVWKYEDIVVCIKETDARRYIKVNTSLSPSKWSLYPKTSQSVPEEAAEADDNLRATA